MNDQTAAEPKAAPPPHNHQPQDHQSQDNPANANRDPNSQATPEQDVQPTAERIAALEAELAEMKERWMRAEAENANVRTRARKDVDDTRQYAVQKFATDVVEAAENLKRGIDSLPPATDDQPAIVAKVRDGLEGVERSFVSTLERNGIKREDPTGRAFDPNLHQAMQEQESDQHAPGTVLQAWSMAWTLNGRLLRPAMVVVSKAPAPELTGPSKT
jgi:molecular chaperone GrpE